MAAGTVRRFAPRPSAGAAAILRSLVAAAAMFAVAVLAGALLSGAAPASRADQPAALHGPVWQAQDVSEAAAERALAEEDTTTFARSMVVSGAAALTVSVIGLVVVGRRRRLW